MPLVPDFLLACAVTCFCAAYAAPAFQESVILLLFPLFNAGATVVSLDSDFRLLSKSTNSMLVTI